jgi:hypothetical protein
MQNNSPNPDHPILNGKYSMAVLDFSACRRQPSPQTSDDASDVRLTWLSRYARAESGNRTAGTASWVGLDSFRISGGRFGFGICSWAPHANFTWLSRGAYRWRVDRPVVGPPLNWVTWAAPSSPCLYSVVRRGARVPSFLGGWTAVDAGYLSPLEHISLLCLFFASIAVAPIWVVLVAVSF